MQSASLKEAELACRRLELKAKESAKRAALAKVERDVTRHELARVQRALTVGMTDSSVPLTPEFFANPRCPPSISSTAPAPNPTVVSKE